MKIALLLIPVLLLVLLSLIVVYFKTVSPLSTDSEKVSRSYNKESTDDTQTQRSFSFIDSIKEKMASKNSSSQTTKQRQDGETSLSLYELTMLSSGKRFDYQIGEYIPVAIVAKSDFDPTNLFVAKIKFDPTQLQVESIKTQKERPDEDWNFFVKNWVEQDIDNVTGRLSLVGGLPQPGFKTEHTKDLGKQVLAIINFQAKRSGVADVTFLTGTEIYSNTTNFNILLIRRDTKLTIED